MLTASAATVPIRSRSRGLLAGTRLAGTIGRILVQSTMMLRSVNWLRWGFLIAMSVLTLSSFRIVVDPTIQTKWRKLCVLFC